MKKINPLFAIFVIAFWIGIYQVNLVAQKFNSYGISYNLTEDLPWGMNAQQWVENKKIYLKNISFSEPPKEQVFQVAKNTIEHVSQGIQTPHATSEVINLANKQKCKENCTVLTIGDSIMGDVYYSLNRQLKKHHPDWKIVNAHKVSSGLSKSTYYNWHKVTEKLVQEVQPDYVIMLIGMNDAQGIIDDGKDIQFNTVEWKKVYTQKVQTMFSIMNRKSTALWIELPNVKSEGFDKKLSQIREIHKSVTDNSYVSVRNIIGDNRSANFSKFRQADGIHLNAIGADMIAEYIYTHNLN